MSLINDGINWVKTDEEGIPVTKVLEELTWAGKPSASAFGKGQAWFRDIGAMGYSDGTNWSIVDAHSRSAPSAFNWDATLPEVYAIKNGNEWTCNLKPEDLINTTGYTNTYYVDGRDGVDANSGLTWALRKKTIKATLTAASASGLPSRILVYSDSGRIKYVRSASWANGAAPFVSAVPILIEAFEGRIETGPFDAWTWTLTAASTYTYEITRSNANSIYNPSIKESVYGAEVYTQYKWVASAAAVETTEGSWYTDNVKCYVHPHGNIPATDANARVYLTSNGAGWNCNKNLFVRGFDFEGGTEAAFKVMGGSTNTVVFDDCTFRYAVGSIVENGGTTIYDSVAVLGCKLFAAFNCKADKSSKDGFNFHSAGAVIPSALLVNCSAFKNGTYGTSNNGFTCHDGVKAISIGCSWLGSRGTNSGHVTTGTQVWSVGDVAGSSIGDVIIGGAIAFAGYGIWEAGAGLGAPDMWLDSCQGIGAKIDLYTDGVGSLYTHNFKGTGTRSGTIQGY